MYMVTSKKVMVVIMLFLLILIGFEVAHLSLISSSTALVKKKVDEKVTTIIASANSGNSQKCVGYNKAKDPLVTSNTVKDVGITLERLEKKFGQHAYLTLETNAYVSNIVPSNKSDNLLADVKNNNNEVIAKITLMKSPTEKNNLIKIHNGKETRGDYKEVKNGDRLLYRIKYDLVDTSNIIVTIYYYK